MFSGQHSTSSPQVDDVPQGNEGYEINPTILEKVEKICRDALDMARKLTVAIFSEDELVSSNVEGKNQKPKLDPVRVEAIMSKLWPLQIQQGNFHMYRNSTLRSLVTGAFLFVYRIYSIKRRGVY